MKHKPMNDNSGLGLVEWFRPGERERAEKAVEAMRGLGISSLRTGISWADFHRPEGRAWYDWLIPRLGKELELLPCILYTPPSLGVEPHTAAPPRNLKAYADFVDQVIHLYGDHFEWVELWNEPNNLNDWDWRLDPGWEMFCDMVGRAAYWARRRGKKTLLAGTAPFDPSWLKSVAEKGLLKQFDAVGIHGFPGTWDMRWEGWENRVDQVRNVLEQAGSESEIWITEAGYSTRRHDEMKQVELFREAQAAPVERVYWYALQDLDPERSSQEGFHQDERHYHMGLLRADGSPKLLARLFSQGGHPALERLGSHTRSQKFNPARRRVLVTGGAGFIGSNLSDRLAAEGNEVLVFDNLSRPGVEENLYRLREKHGERIVALIADVRDRYAVRDAVADAEKVFHFAAQVAVTTSVASPEEDFEINARGTLNLLEAVRLRRDPPPLIYTSTNKVYGDLASVDFMEQNRGFRPVDGSILEHGIDENRPLDLFSPYGCSKGAADQYVLDYARIYRLPLALFRMSCIYGPYQYGTEDQGWVAHFLIRALQGEPITLYGNGKQVRDVLFVGDLVEALLTAQQETARVRGMAFNIGGGPAHAVSLLEMIEKIESRLQRTVTCGSGPWRPGDQVYYVSDNRRFSNLTGWRPRTGIDEGLGRLHQWLERNHPFRRMTSPAETATL